MPEHAEATETSIAGQYLTFSLSEETYALELLKVHEIIGIMPVTRVPRTPEFVRGVVNLRGKVIPVVDLRLKFGMAGQEDTERTCIIVVQICDSGQEVTMGVLVDQVAEVVDITAEQIEPAPSFGTTVDTEFIMAMGKIGDDVVMLLDVDKVLTGGELDLLDQTSEAG